MNQTNAKTWHWTGIGGLPKRCPCGMFPVAATSLHSFSTVSGHSEGAAKKETVYWYIRTWVKARGKPFCFANWPLQIFLPWTWNWYKPRGTCNWNAKFRSKLSNREKGPTFLDFPLFLGIFQWDEPIKRFPFTGKPKFPDILNKWKVPFASLLAQLWDLLWRAVNHSSLWLSRKWRRIVYRLLHLP